MQKWKIAFLPIILAILGAAHNPAGPGRAAETYLQQAIEIIKINHRASAAADWPDIIAKAQSQINDAETPEDTHPAIREILRRLDEKHSFFIARSAIPAPNKNISVAGQSPQNAASLVTWRLIDERFGMIALPALSTLGADGPEKGASYTKSVQQGLIEMDQSPLCGWIIDLRQNGGGNMWPMLWGLDPLLGKSPFGFFVPPTAERQAWVRASGSIFPTTESLPETPPAYALSHQSAPVAILFGPMTASSGEMIALALIGRENVRTFGLPSAGYTSANKTHPLSDGSLLVITESSVMDRTGQEYTGPITPDEVTQLEAAEQAATRWLAGRCD